MHPPTFFERFGHLGICVLPVEVLDDTQLPDPDTGLPQPSLRERCGGGPISAGLCYAKVYASFGQGQYWADVAATPDDLTAAADADAEHIMLTEEDLTSALAWDERLYRRSPAQIHRLMRAQARNLAPLCPHIPDPEAVLLPTPTVPLVAVEPPVEVTTDDLCMALTPASESLSGQSTPRQRNMNKRLGVSTIQQGLLRALSQALQRDLARTDHQPSEMLQALTILVERVRDFHRRTRQRVVNAVKVWDAGWNRWVWHLILGVPEALLVAGVDAVATA